MGDGDGGWGFRSALDIREAERGQVRSQDDPTAPGPDWDAWLREYKQRGTIGGALVATRSAAVAYSRRSCTTDRLKGAAVL